MNQKSFGNDVVMDITCYKLLDGVRYNIAYVDTLGAAGNSDVLIIPATDTVAFFGNVASDAASYFTFYEGVTTSANGTSMTAYNHNRNSADTTMAAIFKDPTWSTNSEVLLHPEPIPAGVGPRAVGGSIESADYWVLNDGEKYLLRTTDRSGASNTIYWNIELCT